MSSPTISISMNVPLVMWGRLVRWYKLDATVTSTVSLQQVCREAKKKEKKTLYVNRGQ